MSAWWQLFTRLSLRPLWQEKLRTLLVLLAVALGVAVLLAMELAGEAAAGSFRASMETLAGEADFEVTSPGGMPAEVLTRFARHPLPLTLTPRIEDYARIMSDAPDNRRTVPLIGMDTLQIIHEQAWLDPAAKPPTAPTVVLDAALGYRKGERIRLQVQDVVREYEVGGLIPPDKRIPSHVVLMDLAIADEALRRNGRIDRILIDLPRGANADTVRDELRALLPAGIELKAAGARTDSNRRILDSFRWNLRVLSMIALVVGAFLIYNTISVSVVRRRRETGVLRALGATQWDVLFTFLAEAAFYGVVGGALGLIVGRLLAEGVVFLIAFTVDSLYVSSAPAPLQFTLPVVVVSLLAGLAVSLLAAFAPAWEASRTLPVEAMARGRAEYQVQRRSGWLLLAALALGIAAALLTRVPPVGSRPVAGYIAAVFLIGSASLCIPSLLQAARRVADALVLRVGGMEARIALRTMAASTRRTSVLAASLAVAIAMITAVGIMVGSFRTTMLTWIDNQLTADFYVRPVGVVASDRFPEIDPRVADLLERSPLVEAVDRFRAWPGSFRDTPVTLAAGDVEVASRYGRIPLLEGDRGTAMARMLRGEGVLVSEPFVSRHRVRLGEKISFPLGGKMLTQEVVGIYYDYASERGYILMPMKTLREHMPNVAPSSLAVYLKPGTDINAARVALEKTASGFEMQFFENRMLRQEAIRVFDRTFAVTWALEIIAIFVAVTGVASALLAQVIDRRREFGLLRMLGGAKQQMARIILTEAGFLGLLANFVGLPLGGLLSLVLIFVINKQSFGWTIRLHWPAAALLLALFLVFVSTILAGVWPGRAAMRLEPSEVMHEE
jgi:putative ABC transport system permease protein